MTHHHHSGHTHPSPSLAPSLLRLSAWQRFGWVAVVLAVLWAAVAWALA